MIVVHVLEELNIGYMVFTLLVNGLLTAKYKCKFGIHVDYRSIMPQFVPEAIDQNVEFLTLLRQIAKDKMYHQRRFHWYVCSIKSCILRQYRYQKIGTT